MRPLPALSLGLLVFVAACDRPGPLSAVGRGRLPKPPTPPAWSAPLHGQALASAFPGQADCVGYGDKTQELYKGARKVTGWAWNITNARPVRRLAAVDAAGRMVGFGVGELPRPDIPAARPGVGSPNTGWSLITPNAQRSYAVYGLVYSTRSACLISRATPAPT